MQTFIKEKLRKYANEKEQILALFYVKSRNQSKEFTEVYTVVDEVIVSKMLLELSDIFDDVILTNKKKDSFKLDKKWQNYTILEVFTKEEGKISESIISHDLAKDFIKNLPNDLEFLYDKMDLKSLTQDYNFVYELPKEYEFDQCIRQFFSYAMEVSSLLVDKNQIAASLKMDYLKKELLKMVDWYIRDRFSKTKDIGKDFENLAYSLEEEYRVLFLETFFNADYLEIYKALFKACDLFRKLGLKESTNLGFKYLKKEDVEVLKVLRNNYKKIESLVL
ncbi:MAG: aminoglycoside 6-adenylyltransferase [Peptoniphilaceae bacterium]|nr:aminoglycoside 6-adenylyltransferase [Peptoniphilaceae bacterium]MDY6019499.1 aminoglycoside 6-adenylyltransferase [Anaerococcus sp.]